MDLIDRTNIDRILMRGEPVSGGEKIDAPFFRDYGVNPQSFLGIVGMDWEYRKLFNEYIKDKYGAVTELEMNKIFMLYVDEVKEVVMQINPISFTFTDNLDESIEIHPKQQQLFDYVLKEMLDGTEIRPPIPGRLLLIVPEFIKPASPFMYPHYLKSPAFPIPMHKMVKYFKDNYGLMADEVITLWNRYREIMYRELRINFPVSFRDDAPVEEIFKKGINEGMKYKGTEHFKRIDNPKQHKFFNKIADKVIELIEIRDSEWGREIFLTDLLDPDYPGQGMSLPPPVGMPDYDTFAKRMGTVIQDFFPMLEKYWYIDDIFTNIFILTKFIFPKLWNNFYKDEYQPEESTDYGERALDYEEKMGKEHKSDNNLTFKEEINESTRKQHKFLDVILRDMIDQTDIVRSEFGMDTIIVPGGTGIFLFDNWIQTNLPPKYMSEYMRDTYGLTEEEMTHMWLRYKDIMLHKIKERDPDNNPFRPGSLYRIN